MMAASSVHEPVGDSAWISPALAMGGRNSGGGRGGDLRARKQPVPGLNAPEMVLLIPVSWYSCRKSPE